MKIAVISDLHLGPTRSVDAFGHDDAEFLRFLRFLENNFERIVLLGDIWETLTGALPGQPRTELQTAREAHREIAARFARPEYLYVHGNHDLVAGASEGAPEELMLAADGTRILFTHGHQEDTLVRCASWVSELAVWLGGWLRRLGLSALYELGTQLDHVRTLNRIEQGREQFERWAVGTARRQDADILVTGHTHVASEASCGHHLLLNSGSCTNGEISFCALDTRIGQYGIHHGW